MKKDMTLEVNSKQVQNGSSERASLLPYTAPELYVYNQAKITMGGLFTMGVDFIGPTTNYKVS